MSVPIVPQRHSSLVDQSSVEAVRLIHLSRAEALAVALVIALIAVGPPLAALLRLQSPERTVALPSHHSDLVADAPAP